MEGRRGRCYWAFLGECVSLHHTLSLSHHTSCKHAHMSTVITRSQAANNVARDEDKSASSVPTGDEDPQQVPEKKVNGVFGDIGVAALETFIDVAKEQNWPEKFKSLFKAILEAFEERAVQRATDAVAAIVPQAKELKSQGDPEEETNTDSAHEVGLTATNTLMAVMQKKYVRYVLYLGIAVMLLIHAYLFYSRLVAAGVAACGKKIGQKKQVLDDDGDL